MKNFYSKIKTLATIAFTLALLLLNLKTKAQTALNFVEVLKENINNVTGLNGASDIAVSADGKFVYSAAYHIGAVACFERDLLTGKLTFKSVIKQGVAGVIGITNAFSIAASSDNKSIYVASPSGNITSFSRNITTGALTFTNTVSPEVGNTMTVKGFVSVYVSPDAKWVYGIGANPVGGIAVFFRDANTGVITFVEQHLNGVYGDQLDQDYSPTSSPIKNMITSTNGKFLYVTATKSNTVSVYSINQMTGHLTLVLVYKDGVDGVFGLQGASSLLLSSDGKHLYVSGQKENSIAVFNVNQTTGTLTYQDKLTQNQNSITSLQGVRSLAINPDGKYLYVSAISSNAVTAFNRDASTGQLTLNSVLTNGSGRVEGMMAPSGMMMDPLSKNLYVAGQSSSSIVVLESPVPAVVLSTNEVTTSNNVAVILDPALNIRDADSGNLRSATVKITNGMSADLLSVSLQNGVSATYVASTKTLSLVGIASLSQYIDILRSLSYTPSLDPSVTPGKISYRTISISVVDEENNTSSDAVISVKINPQNTVQTITFPPIAEKFYGDPDFNIIAQSSNLLQAINYTSSDIDIAGIVSGQIKIKKAGTVTITATQIANSGFDVAVPVSQTLTIKKAPLSITADPQTKVYGQANPGLTYQITTGQLFSSDQLTGTIARDAGENVGTYTINQGTLQASANYDLTFKKADFTITKATVPGITFSDDSFTYDGTKKSLALTGTLPTGITVKYVNNNQSEAGTYTVTANIAGGNNYENKTLKADLTINKATIPGITFKDERFTYDGTKKSLALTGTLPTGVTVNYVNNNQSEADTYTVTANIAGGNNYENKTLTAVLTINKATVTGITFSDERFTYDGTKKSLALTGTLPTDVTVNYVNNDQSEADTYTVTANIAGGNNYENKTLKADLTINKATIPGITFKDERFTYDGTKKSLALTGTLPTGVTVNYVNNDQSEAGTYTVTANIVGGNNYENKTLKADLTITKATIPGITFKDERFTYDGTKKSLALTGTLPTGVTVNYVNNNQSEAGTYTVTANIVGGNNYENKTLKADLTITKATVTGITFSDERFTYDGTKKSLALTGTLPTDVTVNYVNNDQSEADTYTVTANIVGGNNYENKTLKADLTITKATVTGITFKDERFTYDGTKKSLALTGTLPTGVTVKYVNNNQSEADTYPVTANIAGGNNYENKTLTAVLTINKATVTGITFSDEHFTYDGTKKSLALTGTLPTDVTVNYVNNDQSEADTYTVTANIVGGNNYENKTLKADLTITKATVTGITFKDERFTYDGTKKSLALTGTLPTGVTVKYVNNNQSEAATYPVTANIAGGNNYENKTLKADLTITKATVTGITFKDERFTYDGTKKSLALTGTLPTGVTVKYVNNNQSEADTYPVTANIAGGNNYENKTLTAVLTINKATVTGITFSDEHFTYDGTKKSLALTGTLPTDVTVNYVNNDQSEADTYTVTANIVGGNNYENKTLKADLTITKATVTGITFKDERFTYDGTKKSLALTGTLPTGVTVKYVNNNQSEAATYPVTANIAGGNNYENKTLTAVLTINKATIPGITFKDERFTYDGTKKSLALTGTLPTGVTVNYVNNNQSEAGTYTITANIAGGNNYENKTLTAVLTINKATQVITWTQNLTIGCEGENTLILNATASSGLPVHYTSSNSTIASVIGNSLTFNKQGFADITAQQDGNNNYLPATHVVRQVSMRLIGKVKKKWDDVLIFDNSSDEFVSWQWYKDGQAILGAQGQYYTSPTPLNGSYMVVVTDKTGNTTETCPLVVVAGQHKGGVKVVPNPARQGTKFTIKSDYSSEQLKGAKIMITDIAGKLYKEINQVSPELVVQVPMVPNVYFVYLFLENGKRESVKLLVN